MTTPETTVNPWDRRDTETDKAFSAFVAYRDMGDERSITNVSRQLGKGTAIIQRWSAKHKWVDRAASWDQHLDSVKQNEFEDEMREVAKRHATIAKQGLSLVIRRLFGTAGGKTDRELTPEERLAGLVGGMDPAELSADQTVRFATAFAQLERDALGLVNVSESAELAELQDRYVPLIDMDDPEDQDNIIWLAETLGMQEETG